ncbi:MAG: hypothetical protein FJ403_11920 [Verrucomicrobia bacterium]|nr:hypothetical protein [Verrucomicrobiota bacterium]
MNAKVTPSGAGSQLPPDPRFGAHYFKRKHRMEEAKEESKALAADVFKSRDASADEASTGVGRAISLSQAQGGFLQMVEKALDRMNELSVLCQDGSRTDVDRAEYTSEFTQLQNFISDIGAKKFNGAKLFSTVGLDVALDGGSLPLNAIDLNAKSPEGGLMEVYHPGSTEIETQASAAQALSMIALAFRNLAEMQAKVSANIQRLNLSSEQLSLLRENLSAATNRINGLDLAKSLADVVRTAMLRQSGTTMIAQANTIPQAAIRLLD